MEVTSDSFTLRDSAISFELRFDDRSPLSLENSTLCASVVPIFTIDQDFIVKLWIYALIQWIAYDRSLIPRYGSNFFTAIISPIFPSWMRS